MLLLLLLLPLLLLLRCLLAEWRRRARGRQRGETRDLPARIVQSLDAVALRSRSTLNVRPALTPSNPNSSAGTAFSLAGLGAQALAWLATMLEKASSMAPLAYGPEGAAGVRTAFDTFKNCGPSRRPAPRAAWAWGVGGGDAAAPASPRPHARAPAPASTWGTVRTSISFAPSVCLAL